jgi:hypothetical protein
LTIVDRPFYFDFSFDFLFLSHLSLLLVSFFVLSLWPSSFFLFIFWSSPCPYRETGVAVNAGGQAGVAAAEHGSRQPAGVWRTGHGRRQTEEHDLVAGSNGEDEMVTARRWSAAAWL